jgi:hypothetical protein
MDHKQKLGLNIFENRTAGNLPQNFLSLKIFIKITQTAEWKIWRGYWETTGLFFTASRHT